MNPSEISFLHSVSVYITFQGPNLHQINKVNYQTHSVWFFIGKIMQKNRNNPSETSNTGCLIKSIFNY